MLCLVNTNRMIPPIAPVGLDYVAGATRRAGIETEILDLCFEDRPIEVLTGRLSRWSPRLVGLTFRNVDDCFWPRGEWFVPWLAEVVASVKMVTDAAIVLGGVGYSMFPRALLERTGADFGIAGDGEVAVVALHGELEGHRRFHRVPGLIWSDAGKTAVNPPSFPDPMSVGSSRDAIDNVLYFRQGGQGGVETKRGCGRRCIYCADPIAKGSLSRLRPPSAVADEVNALLQQGVDVLHLCDSEFNLPASHAKAVCAEIVRRNLGDRVRWYAYLAVTPFDGELASLMRRAGCAGINFTGDSASDVMLSTYGHPHRKADMASAIRLCRKEGIVVMIDLLLGGPGETPETASETIEFLRAAEPNCVGAALGARIYPGTKLETQLRSRGPLDGVPGVRRTYDGPVDLLRPTFYVSAELGPRPADLVRDLIREDPRFFAPPPDPPPAGAAPEPRDGWTPSPPDRSHNYNRNQPLEEALRAGARGAYWDILRKLRHLDET